MTGKTTRHTFRMVAKTLYGLEDILAAELRELGATDINPMNRSVEFAGDLRVMYAANVYCRTAIRVLQPIRTFRCADGDRLYREVRAVEWGRFLDPAMTIAVDAVVSHSGIDNSLFAAQRVKDAVVDQIREGTGRRPSVDLIHPDLRINLHLHENHATIALDSSGESLHRRGYRTEAGKAPINEVLAAGIIVLSGWDMALPLVDGMCGSGTFVIEAALMARRIAPGLIRRQFGFQRMKDYNRTLYDKVIAEARGRVRKEMPCRIFGSDSDGAVLKEARANAKRAGVDHDIVFEQKDFAVQNPPAGPGVLIMNPPYGERLAVRDIEALYRMIGDTLKAKYRDYTAFLFTGNLAAMKSVGLRTSRRITLYNGPLESRLLRYEMYQGSRKQKNLPE
ncbi:MAG: hypothetical protein JW763_03435 [candidate division Zixibacteria bacterium]|nr:hypothetical protein [candidate division Zixibacteria bacterium]